MEHFDELVCDPRLRRDELLDFAARMTRDQLYLDRYRVMLTSGSSGRPGLFVYDAPGWRSICSQFLRTTAWAGLHPTLPRQRIAFIGGAGPSHISRQGAATLRFGLHRVLPLPVTLPLPQLVQALNQFQPTYLHVYPSAAMWLAEEQYAGRLRMSPRILVTSAELRTPQMTQRLVEVFGVRPFNVFACTEGLFGSECEHHQGIHLLEETLVENVDPDGEPVPAGEPGARLLVTNLHNLVQPLLRLEVTDVVTLDPDPCPCGRILARMTTIHGRSDDIISLPARDGSPVAVHPLHFALLSSDPQVREFQIIQDGPTLRVLVVPTRSPNLAPAAADDELEKRIRYVITRQLLELGVHHPHITVERRQELNRTAGGKLKLVIADPAPHPRQETSVQPLRLH
jgi:phenylacetate-CoA ligase